MLRFVKLALVPAVCLTSATACSNTGGLAGSNVATSSINGQQAAKKPAIDPACVSLVSKIDSLRKDGITDRVAKAGEGKSKTVSVYRTSLAKMAELDRANADYQRRCGTLKPATATAAVAKPAAAPAKQAAAKPKPQPSTKKSAANSNAKSGAAKTAAKAPAKPAVKTVAKAKPAADGAQKANTPGSPSSTQVASQSPSSN